MNQSDIVVIHAYGDKPKITTCADKYVEKGRVYYVPSGEKYTISKTEEELNERIRSLLEQNDVLAEKLYAIDYILNPNMDDEEEE